MVLGLFAVAACSGGSGPGPVGGANGQQAQLGTDAAVAPNSDASGWVTVGNTDGGAVSNYAFSGRVAVGGGIPYAIFSDYSVSSRLTLMKLASGKWTVVGNAGFSAEAAYTFTLYVDGSTPYVAYVGSSNYKLTVMQWNGSAWVTVGTAGFATADSYGQPSLAVANGTVYAAFLDSSSQLQVMSFNGTAWVSLGGAPLSTYASAPAMTVLNGTVYVAYNDYSTTSVMKLVAWSSTGWTLVGQSTYTIDEDYGQSLTASNGTLYLTYMTYAYGPGSTSSGTCGAIVWKLTDAGLVSVGTLCGISNGNYIEYVSGTVYNGVPYVAYDDESRDSDPNPQAATVKYFNGATGTWDLYAGYANPCDIEDTFIAADQATGQIYFTYSDCNGYMTVQVH
jgi:hypothetical protein